MEALKWTATRRTLDTQQGDEDAPTTLSTVTTLPEGAAQPQFGAWWACDAAVALLRELDAETAALPVPHAALVQHVLASSTFGVLTRTVACAGGALQEQRRVHPVRHDWVAAQHDTERSYANCHAASLSHTFDWPGGSTARLLTLVKTNRVDMPRLPRGAPVMPGEEAVATEAKKLE
jgi:hypothetical protein